VEVAEIKSKLSRLDSLHTEFERQFAQLYGKSDPDALAELLKSLYSISQEKLELASALYRELSSAGGRIEERVKELYRNEHQMKFRLEEILSSMSMDGGYGARQKVGASLERFAQFHRVYDYGVRKALGELATEVEGLTLIAGAENQKKVPAGIMDRLRQVEELEGELDVLKRFLFRLYVHPGDAHKVEAALLDWHSRGLSWVEARNVEKVSGVQNAGELLEGLALIGVVEKKMRGGEGVYRHRNFSPD